MNAREEYFADLGRPANNTDEKIVAYIASRRPKNKLDYLVLLEEALHKYCA